jgi:hypothetical protein
MDNFSVRRENADDKLNVTIRFLGRHSVGQFVWHLFSTFLLAEVEPPWRNQHSTMAYIT